MIKSDDETQKLARSKGAHIGIEKLKINWLETDALESNKIRYISVEQWT
jgi:hypothetical protein